MFLQIHSLTSYPASLLNRDDAGLAKRIPFGNANRLRVSSQCQKRHWRETLQERVPEVPDGYRTRSFFTREIMRELRDRGMEESRAAELIKALAKGLINGGVEDDGEMTQPVLFGKPEADYFVRMLLELGSDAPDTAAAVKTLAERLKQRDEKKNIAAMIKSGAGLTAALFGRFVTSDILARVDAPVHVAHAFTVHGASAEMDYFTVVDDLHREDETGAAHANQAELGAGVYYGYTVVDVPLLVSNLTSVDARKWRDQEPTVAKRVLTELVHAIASKSPGAKLGSTAPYSRAELVLLEAGTQQPRTLANAFLEAVPARGHLVQESIRKAGDYLIRVDKMYGATAKARALATIHDAQPFAPLTAVSLDQAIITVLDSAWSAA